MSGQRSLVLWRGISPCRREGSASTLPYDSGMFRFFETLLPNAVPPPAQVRRSGPPAGLLAFYWHFIAQARILFAA